MNELIRTKEELDLAIDEMRRQKLERNLVTVIKDMKRQVVDQLSPLFKEPPIVNVELPPITVPKTDVTVDIPEIKLPKIVIPEIKAPDVVFPEIPPIKVPKPKVTVKVPPAKITVKEASNKALTKEMNLVRKAISEQVVTFPEPRGIFDDVSFTKPVPVILVDASGEPYIPGQYSGGVTRGGEVKREKTAIGRYDAVAVATTATELLPAKGTRLSVVITHEDDDPIYIGYDSSVTTATGTPVVANQGLTFDNYTGALFAVISAGASSSTISVRYMEV